MGSALRNPQVVDAYLAREVSVGRVAGIFPSPPFSPFHISRFGVILKCGCPGKWRLIIVDLSFPEGRSVNDGIDPDEFTLSYSKVDGTIDIIMQLGCSTLLAKINIRDAYCLISIHPEDHPLLGMFWRNSLACRSPRRLPAPSASGPT